MPLPENFAKEAARLPAPSRKQVEAAVGDRRQPSAGRIAATAPAASSAATVPSVTAQGQQRRERLVRGTLVATGPRREDNGRREGPARREAQGEARGFNPLGQLERERSCQP